jgi:hypothetical protein
MRDVKSISSGQPKRNNNKPETQVLSDLVAQNANRKSSSSFSCRIHGTVFSEEDKIEAEET